MAYNITRCVRIKIVYGKRGELFKYLLAHFVDYFLAQMYHNNGECVGKNCRYYVAGKHKANVFPNGWKVNSAAEFNGINSRTGIFRAQK